LTSLTSFATVIAPLVMTPAFAGFTRPESPVSLPGAPLLLAAGLMIVTIALFVNSRRRT